MSLIGGVKLAFVNLTERVAVALIGGAALVAVVILLTGGSVQDLISVAIAFGLGSVLPSPIERTNENDEN